MKKIPLLMIPFFLLLSLSGCATLVSGGLTGSSYQNASLALAYSNPEVIRDQSKVATLVVPDKYGVAIDGVPVKEMKGEFNPNLRVYKTPNTAAYIIDVLPGTRKLSVRYDGITYGNTGTTSDNTPTLAHTQKTGSSTTVSGSYSNPGLLSDIWIRTSETTNTLKAGEIYMIGPKMLSITGEMDIYPLSESERGGIMEIRNRAQFQEGPQYDGKAQPD